MKHLGTRGALIVVAALSICLSGCTAERFTTAPPKDPAERALGGSQLSPAAYRLTAGDQVRVTVFDLAAEAHEYTVDETGAIAVAAIDPVAIGKMTTKDAAEAISNAFASAGLYRKARVSVEIKSFGPFYVMGEVVKPGEFAYRPGMSLFAAVALAGGHTYRANRSRVFIRRATDTVETEYELTSDLAIFPGDVVRIPELQL